MADGVACESSRCWAGPYPSLNLELNSTLFPSLFARCRIRYNLLADAQRACSLAPWCGGIVQDGGFNGGAWLSRDDEVVRCLIRSGKPFLIGRPSLGAERDVAYLTAVRDKPIPNGALSLLGTNAGVITHGSRESAQAFGHAYLAALNTSDLSVRWDHSSMPKPYGIPRHFKVDELLHVTGHLPNLVLCHESIEPWLVYRQINTTWMAEMAHRTLLVVSPFNESIRKMLDKGGRAIWGDASEEMLPSSMVVKLVRPPVNIGGFADTQSGDWRDSLASLIAAVDAAGPFDLALLSCGGLGMLVAAHLRRTGRAAIYTGGALQLQFGVKGRRWLDHPGGPYLRPMANPSWEWPLPSERPPKRHMIDKGAYWT